MYKGVGALKYTDKFLLFLYLVGTIGLFSIFVILPTGYIDEETANNVFSGMMSTSKWYYFTAAIILILIAIRFIVVLFKGSSERTFGIVKYTSDGEVNISNETIKSLVMKTINQVKGVRDSSVWIKPGEDKINILIKTLIMPDVNIPQTVKEIQENVRKYIEMIAEIPVGEVKVVILDIASGTKLRLE
jgi:uncharacterized alkaline shock family protein YloU